MTCSSARTSPVGPQRSAHRSRARSDAAAGRNEAHIVVDEDHQGFHVPGNRPDHACEVPPSLVGADPQRAHRAPPTRGFPTTARAISTRRRSRARRSRPWWPAGLKADGSRSRRARPCVGSREPARSARAPSHVVIDREFLDRLLVWKRAARAPAGAAKVRHREQILAECPHAPALGLTNPLRTLKNVVFPAPLGPIRPHVPLSKLTVRESNGMTRRSGPSGP